MKKRLKKIPRFKTEGEERSFWASRDSSGYVDWSKARRMVFQNLVPTTRSVPIRFPVFLLDRLRYLAHKKDIPYQSLVKIFLLEKVREEMGGVSRRRQV